MKISVKQYATALYGAVKDKQQDQAKLALANFLKLLVKNNDLKLTDKIIAEFTRIWNEREGLITAEVVSARELDKDTRSGIKEYVIDLSKANLVELEESVDADLLAGFVLKFNDVVMDGSLKTKIGELKEEMIK